MSGRIVVRGFGPSGDVRYEELLAHGWSPQRALRAAGWRPVGIRGFTSDAGGKVTIDYSVLPTATQRVGAGSAGVLGQRPEMVPDTVHQRLAAYAVVQSEHGVLLTELSKRTSRAGLWVLPGGGVEEGESPDAATVREVWEESGQRIELGALVDVSSTHRVGEFHGGLEDFHAVRMIFDARCPRPEALVVHDVGGSTGRAAWFAAEDIVNPNGPLVPGGVASWAVAAVRTALGGSCVPK